jgi:predicted nucleic acid-binding protein
MALVVVLDASAIIAFLDPADAHHAAAVAALRAVAGGQLVIPASAYAEILVRPYRAGPPAVTTVEQFIAALAIHVEPISREIARRAAQLRSQHTSLRLPDALVLATADDLNAAVVLTADVAWTKISPRAQVL